MHIKIHHQTLYRYSSPASYSIQQLRLTPLNEAGQQVLNWTIDAPGRRHEFRDAYGNTIHILTLDWAHDTFSINAHGAIEVTPLPEGRLSEPGRLPPLVYTVSTRLTERNGAIEALAATTLGGTVSTSSLLELAANLVGRVQYLTGATSVGTSAADALQLGHGVCQDHAHLFIACCHAFNLPARYVSGYIDSGQSEHAESHAWVDVWLDTPQHTGWVSIDVTHACFASGAYCRLAVGRDYDSAGPTRGIRRGGGMETMTVHVDLTVD